MSLTSGEKQLIKSSFKMLNKNEGGFASCFYDHLFELAPLIKPMFKSDRSLNEKHFYELFSTATVKIDNFAEIRPLLIELGRRHKAYGVKRNQFAIVKNALMLSIQYQLKGRCNSSIEDAWSKYFDEISEAMLVGLVMES